MKQSNRLDVVVSYTKTLFIAFADCKHLLYSSATPKHCKWSAMCNKSSRLPAERVREAGWAACSMLAAQLGKPPDGTTAPGLAPTANPALRARVVPG